MKKILPLLILLMTAGSLSGGTFHGQWIVRDASSNAVKFSSFTIQPISTYGTSTSNTITGDRKTFRTDSDGRVTVSNLFNGRSYRVQITGPNFTTTFTNSFDTNVTGLVNGADYISAPIRDAGLVAYSQTQADARFLRTNISHIVRPGDNITITTNGAGPSQYLTISASGGGGSATNIVMRGATPGLLVTNGSGDWTLTGSAIYATNLTTGGTIGEIVTVTKNAGGDLLFKGPGAGTNVSLLFDDGGAGGLWGKFLYGDGSGVTNIAFDGFSLATKQAITNAGTGGGGSVNFAPGQSTTWRTVSGSNVVDVTGTLTNNTTGNAATATSASSATLANNLTAGAIVNPVNAYSVTNFSRSHLFNYPATMSYTTNAPDTNDLLLVEYGDPLAPLMPRPPIMWNSWYAFPGIPAIGDLPSHYMITNMIRFIREQGLPYNTICISDGWQQYYRSNGLIVANWTNWNSTVDFITNTINACHEAGFKVHTYTAFNNYGWTCMGLPGCTPSTIDADMAEFARLGFDGVTVDCCETAFYNNVKYQQQLNRQVFRAVARTGRPMQIHTACVAGGLNGLNLPESMGMVNMLSGFNSNRNDKTPWYPHPEEFTSFGLSNVWSTAYKWLTGPYYDHFAGQHRPGHFNFSTCFNIVQDSAANHRYGRYQISLLSLFQTPFVTGAYTNHTYFTRYLSATNLYWQIHQDPLCKYPSLVWSNDSTMVWKKELGGTNLGSVAFAVMNLRPDGGSATNVPVTWDQLGMDTNREVSVQCLWYGTNTTAKGGVTLNVPADDILFMKASYRYAPPSVAQGDEVVVRFEDEMRFTSESTTVNTMATYGPAPWYNNHGLQQLSPTPSSQHMRWCWSPPPNATNALVRFQFYSAYAGDVHMTNYPTVTYNAPSGRVIFEPSSDARLTNNPFMLTNGQMRWVTNYIAWDATNTSVFLQLITLQSSNSSSRYVLGPMFVKYGYK